jgi:tRNA (cmo5U34)-methyltransferase
MEVDDHELIGQDDGGGVMTESPLAQNWTDDDTDAFAKYGDALVPRREEQIATVCDLLSDLPVPYVLDLCCGEGRLSEEYLGRSPEAKVRLMDGSAEMLSRAGRRLSRFAGRHAQVQADIADRDWRTGESYGGVMTSLAVHHLDGPGKQELYRDIHGMLRPGGAFVMADLVEPAGPAARKLAGDQWDRSVQQASQELFGGDEALTAFRGWDWNYYRLPGPDPFDLPSSAAEHLDWLRAAGFAEVDVAWMYAGHAIFTARRAAARS